MLTVPSLLITDDDRDVREALRQVFQRRGFQTLLAEDGQEALEVVTRSQVHVVLMDLHMPRLDGLEAISRIHQIYAQLPCILISAALDDRVRSNSELFSVLSKPITVGEVTQTVHSAMRQAYNWQV